MQEQNNNLELPPSPSEINLLDLLQVVVKRSRMIFMATVVAAVISILYSLSLPNIYTAKTLIVAARDDNRGLGSAMTTQLGALTGVAGGALGMMTINELYVSMLKSESVKDPIIDRFKLMEVLKKKYRSDLYKTLDNKARASANKKDGVITIEVSDKDPKRAADMANAYVQELERLAIRLNITGAGQNRLFLEERLARARVDLAKAEEDLKSFQSKNKAFQVMSQAEASLRGVAELKARLAAQEVQLATYRRQFTESSQEVKNLATLVAGLKAQLAKLEGSEGNSTIPSVASMPAIGQEYVRLTRELKIQESMVELLTRQYEMAKLSEAKEVSPFQIIQKAKVPEKKSKPIRRRIVLLATFAAFFVSVIMAFVIESIAKMPEEDQNRWKALLVNLPYYERISAQSKSGKE